MSRSINMIIGELVPSITSDISPILSIATIDLCDPGGGGVARLIDSEPAPDSKPVYFYGPDGNTRVTEDGQGKRLHTVSPQAVLESLEANYSYRRFEIALATLEAIMKRFPSENIVVVFYEQ